MSKPSAALRTLQNLVANETSTEPVTWGVLGRLLEHAVDSQEYSEWEDSMGDDL